LNATPDPAVRLNIGCGARPISGYVNIDFDSKEEILARYPGLVLPEGLEILNYDIFNLPYGDGAVAEVRCDSLVEHLSFLEEKRFFHEMRRVLAVGGELQFSVPDFEATVRQWLEAKDDWQDFYRNDPEAIAQNHWFGTYSYGAENRWGYLMASIFGSQNGAGQYHRNAYTRKKIGALLRKVGFEVKEMSTFLWKGEREPMIFTRAIRLPPS